MGYKDPAKERERNRRRREYLREYQRRWHKRNPTKRKIYDSRRDYVKVFSRYALHKAIRDGLIIKPKICSRCKSALPVEGHHPNHNKPLIVLWLCKSCHGLQHRK